jgi:hypothetical protein
VAHNRGNGNADRAEPSAADLRAGGTTWPTSAPKPASTAIWRSAAPARTGDILLALAAAEGRHEQHWLALLKGDVGKPRRCN